jgi:hypothetical protein
MNRTKILFLLLMLPLPLLFTGCEKTDNGSHVDPLTIYEKLPGTWTLSSLKLVDEVAKASSLTPYEMDIKPKFGFSAFKITFHIDSSYLPTSYEVTGGAPELFMNSGYWDLDSPFTHTDGKPTELNLYSDEGKTMLVDKLSVTALPGTRAELEFRLIRESEGTPYATYVYKLRLDQ